LYLLICSAVVSLQAAGSERSLFASNQTLFTLQTKSSDLFTGKYSPPGWNGLASTEKMPTIEQDKPKKGDIIAEILGGILGNAGGVFIGGCIASFLLKGEDKHSFPPGLVYGIFGGSVVGSALGVYWAGNSDYIKGNFGITLLGSVLGELAVFGLATSNNDSISIIPAALFPVIGAVIGYNISLKFKALPKGNALLNLNEGKLALGIPQVKIRRILANDENAKPAFGFNVRVFSVKL
jgi:hypothetical protein